MKTPFIPNKQAAVLAKAVQMHGVLSDTGVVPADYGLTAQDVTDLGTILATAQDAAGGRDAAKETKKSKTTAFSGDGAAFDQLVAEVRDLGNKIRISDATDDMVQAVGVDRRSPTRTPRTITTDAPEFTLDTVLPGFIRLRARDKNSASPRARTTNASGIQIAVVDGTTARADGEADTVPNRYASRSPMEISSDGLPAKVRLYARWQTQRGQVSGWSLPLLVTVVPS
jgi:hypothetical protein